MVKLELEIPDGAKECMQKYADHEGVSLHTLATKRLLEAFHWTEQPSMEEGSLLDFLGDLVGSVGDESEPIRSSRDAGTQFTNYLEQKKE